MQWKYDDLVFAYAAQHTVYTLFYQELIFSRRASLIHNDDDKAIK